MADMTKLLFDDAYSDGDRVEVIEAHDAWLSAREESSADDEYEAANALISALLAYAEISTIEVPKCDECDNEATEFWPSLKDPVQLCESCTYNAHRSGWEPGR